MTTGHVFIAVSLDGFVARRDGRLDWLMKQSTRSEDHGYDAFMATVDGLVVGRRSFEAVLAFDRWPYEKPVHVLSRSLTRTDIPPELRPRVEISALSPTELMHRLDSDGWKRAYVDGGLIVQSFLRAGLIADITLTHVPILIGQGRPLFGALDRDVDLKHIETRTYPSGLVTSRYEVV